MSTTGQPRKPFGLDFENDNMKEGFLLYLQDGMTELVVTGKEDWSAEDRELCRDQMVSLFLLRLEPKSDHVWRIKNEKRLAQDQAREEREYAELFNKKKPITTTGTPTKVKSENDNTSTKKSSSPKVTWKGSCLFENQQANNKKKLPVDEKEAIGSGSGSGIRGLKIEPEQAECHKPMSFTAYKEAEQQCIENQDSNTGIIASASAFLADNPDQEQKKLFFDNRKAEAAAEAKALKMMQAEYEEDKTMEDSHDSGFIDADEELDLPTVPTTPNTALDTT